MYQGYYRKYGVDKNDTRPGGTCPTACLFLIRFCNMLPFLYSSRGISSTEVLLGSHRVWPC